MANHTWFGFTHSTFSINNKLNQEVEKYFDMLLSLQNALRLTLVNSFCRCIKPLPDDKILDWSKLKPIADDILK